MMALKMFAGALEVVKIPGNEESVEVPAAGDKGFVETSAK